MSAGALYNAHLAQYMRELRCKSCNADPDSWMKAKFMSEVKLKCYSYILCYLNEIIYIHHDSDDELIKLNCYVPVKLSSVSRSGMYIGTMLMHMELHNVW